MQHGHDLVSIPHLAWLAVAVAALLAGCTLTTDVDTGYIQSCTTDVDCADGERCGPEGFCGPASLFGDVSDDDTTAPDDDTAATAADVSDTSADTDVATQPDSTQPDTTPSDVADADTTAPDTVDDTISDTAVADTADTIADTTDTVSDATDTTMDVVVVELPTCTVDPRTFLSDISFTVITNDSDAYREPTQAQRDSLQSSLGAALSGDDEAALTQADAAGYGLCAWPDGTGRLLGFYPLVDGEGGALWLVRDAPDASGLVLESAQTINTALPGLLVDLFDQHRARAILLTPAEKCSSATTSGCSGTASCGDGTHRASDVQHSDTTYFLAAHREMASRWPDTRYLVIYDLAATPDVVISNGTTADVADTSRLAMFTNSLAASFPALTVKSCSAYPGAPAIETDASLCSLDDVLGLELNGVSNVCTGAATSASGRYVGISIVLALGADEAAVSQAVGLLAAP